MICALHSDPTLPQRSGHTFVTAELAVEYGITDTQAGPRRHTANRSAAAPLF